jgi:hypothetical protein
VIIKAKKGQKITIRVRAKSPGMVTGITEVQLKESIKQYHVT